MYKHEPMLAAAGVIYLKWFIVLPSYIIIMTQELAQTEPGSLPSTVNALFNQPADQH